MRISDWSSDVCSSDLQVPRRGFRRGARERSSDTLRSHVTVLRGHSKRFEALAGAPPASATATASNSLSADARSPPSGSSCSSNWMLRRPNPSPLPPLSFTQAYGLSVTKHQRRSEEHTSELQSLMRTSYAVFCLKKK